MDSILYPYFQIIEQRGQLIPSINLPENYKELVKTFYAEKGRESIEKYVEDLKRIIKGSSLETDINLQWDKETGLRNISVGPSGGLDLNEGGWPSFQEHNLGTKTSFVAGAVAQKYISELLKS